jgi:hypothetical protein
MPIKDDVFFPAASCKKDIIFGGHIKPILSSSYFVRALCTYVQISPFQFSCGHKEKCTKN